MKTFETKRLSLRPFIMEDLQEIQRHIFADPDVVEPFAGRVRALEETRAWLAYRGEQARRDDFGWLAVVRREDKQLLGLVALQCGVDTFVIFEHEPDTPYYPLAVELTYALGKAYWGQGYAFEASQALIYYAFHDLRLQRLVNNIDPENQRSARLAEKLGFKLTRNLHPRWSHSALYILENWEVTTPVRMLEE